MCPSIYNYLSLNDTKVFFVFFKIIHPSAQCWTLASAVCFNGRKLGMQNRPVVKGHVAPSASIQTMENLPVFSFCFLLTHSANKEALLWLTMSADAESSSLWMRSAWEHLHNLAPSGRYINIEKFSCWKGAIRFNTKYPVWLRNLRNYVKRTGLENRATGHNGGNLGKYCICLLQLFFLCKKEKEQVNKIFKCPQIL